MHISSVHIHCLSIGCSIINRDIPCQERLKDERNYWLQIGKHILKQRDIVKVNIEWEAKKTQNKLQIVIISQISPNSRFLYYLLQPRHISARVQSIISFIYLYIVASDVLLTLNWWVRGQAVNWKAESMSPCLEIWSESQFLVCLFFLPAEWNFYN